MNKNKKCWLKPLKADSNFNHYYNAHFPGLYSIVVGSGKNNNCLKRVFVSKPGMLHEDLMSIAGKFLWHPHGYDFKETTLAGVVSNINAYEYMPDDEQYNSQTMFHVYDIMAGIDTGKLPKLKKHKNKVVFFVDSPRHYTVGSSYTLNHEIIHRVVFTPNTDGWFACLVEEVKKYEAPITVYSPYDIKEVPNAKNLYKPISSKEAQLVLDELYVNIVKHGD